MCVEHRSCRDFNERKELFHLGRAGEIFCVNQGARSRAVGMGMALTRDGNAAQILRMSKTVKKLEAQLRVRLFNRTTTRSVSLTKHGSL